MLKNGENQKNDLKFKQYYFYNINKMTDNKELANRINNLDSIVHSVILNFTERAELGFKKYNKNMDRRDLTLIEWLDHSIEEKMDDIIYMQKIKSELIRQNINLKTNIEP